MTGIGISDFRLNYNLCVALFIDGICQEKCNFPMNFSIDGVHVHKIINLNNGTHRRHHQSFIHYGKKIHLTIPI